MLQPRRSVAVRFVPFLKRLDRARRLQRRPFQIWYKQKVARDYEPLSNSQAWSIYGNLQADEVVSFVSEPNGIDPIWKRFSSLNTPSPKVWMDAYLASFCVAGDMEMTTFDQGMRRFEAEGLKLNVL